jgi:transposase
MSRKFKIADYEATLNLSVSLRDALPPNHLARFVVDMVGQLDLSALYARYAPTGGEAFAPNILLALLFYRVQAPVLYGYATGVFSSRRIEKAT